MENTQKKYRLKEHNFQNRHASDGLSQVNNNLPDILQQLEDLFNYNPFYRSREDKDTVSLLQANSEEDEISVNEEHELEENYGYRTPQFKEEEEEDWFYQEEDDDDDDDEGEHEGRG